MVNLGTTTVAFLAKAPTDVEALQQLQDRINYFLAESPGIRVVSVSHGMTIQKIPTMGEPITEHTAHALLITERQN